VVKELTHGGIVLGPDPKASFERGFEEFGPGSVLLIYTDGITEASNKRGTQFGLPRLSRLLKQSHEQSAAMLIDTVFDAVNKHAPESPTDDQTVVVVRRP
jgi:sigma-B regulation protein RsbU (phosphoserine phosphatase)